MTIEELAKKITEEGGFIQLSKILMHNLGTDEAVVYTEMIKNQKYYKEERLLTPDGFFFFTIEGMEYNCNVKKDKQARIIRDLKSRGLIEVKHKGMPKRRFFKVLEDDYAINRVFTDTRVKPEDTEKEPLPDELKAKQKAYKEAMQETHTETETTNPAIEKAKAIALQGMKEAENEPQTSETIVDDVITPIEDEGFKFDRGLFFKSFYKVAGNDEDANVVGDIYDKFFDIVGEPNIALSAKSIENNIQRYKKLPAEYKDYITLDGVVQFTELKGLLTAFKEAENFKDKSMSVFLSCENFKLFCERYRCN